MKNNRTNRAGFTLIELMITILIASIVMLGIAGVMADAHRGYRKMYERIHGDVVTQAYTARLKFDAVCRKSSRYHIAYAPQEVTVLLYSDNLNPGADPDRYARFYPQDNSYPTALMLDTGTYNPGTGATTNTGTETVATNVEELKFSVDGKSVQMTLTLDDGEHGLTVTCSSVRHN